MHRSFRQKFNKEILYLNYTLDQRNLNDIYRTFYPPTTEYSFFSSGHGTFSRIDNIRS